MISTDSLFRAYRVLGNSVRPGTLAADERNRFLESLHELLDDSVYKLWLDEVPPSVKGIV